MVLYEIVGGLVVLGLLGLGTVTFVRTWQRRQNENERSK